MKKNKDIEHIKTPKVIEAQRPKEAFQIIKQLERDGWKSTGYRYRERELQRAGEKIIVKGY